MHSIEKLKLLSIFFTIFFYFLFKKKKSWSDVTVFLTTSIRLYNLFTFYVYVDLFMHVFISILNAYNSVLFLGKKIMFWNCWVLMDWLNCDY